MVSKKKFRMWMKENKMTRWNLRRKRTKRIRDPTLNSYPPATNYKRIIARCNQKRVLSKARKMNHKKSRSQK